MIDAVDDENKSEDEAFLGQYVNEIKISNYDENIDIQMCRLKKIREILKQLQQHHARLEIYRRMDLLMCKEENDFCDAFQAFIWDLRVYAQREPSTHEETQHLLECLQAVEAWLEDPFDADAINDLQKFIQNHTLMQICQNSYQAMLQGLTDHADEILLYLGIIGFFGVSIGAFLLSATAGSFPKINFAGKISLGVGIGMMLTFCIGCGSGCSDRLENRYTPRKYYLNHFGTFARAAAKVYEQPESSLNEFKPVLSRVFP